MSKRLDEWEALLDAASAIDERYGAANVTNTLLAYCLAAIPEDDWQAAVAMARRHHIGAEVGAS